MKKKLASTLAIAIFMFASTGTADDITLTFDDTSYQGTYWGDMEAGYGGFNWSSNFDIFYGPGLGPAYDLGTVSGTYAVFNSSGVSVILSDGAFNWNGAWFNDPHDSTLLNVTGFISGTLLYSADIQLSRATPVWFQANWVGIDAINFNVVGNDWFTMDDFTFNKALSAVPEPSTLLLLGIGIASSLAGSKFRKRNI